MLLDLNTFEAMDFPKNRDIVYVLCFKSNENEQLHPFYVGESSRHVGRIGDYVSARFTASTDFKVGEAVRYLQELDYHVEIKFKNFSDRKSEEKAILKALRVKNKLLNDLVGYNYTKANEQEERLKVRAFIDEIINQNSNVESEQVFVNENEETLEWLNLTIPEKTKIICKELDRLYDKKIPPYERIIYRQDILKIAEKRGMNKGSVTVADYCNNGITSQHSRFKFLHSIKGGQYILIEK